MPEQQSWWTTLPGILTAAAALLTAGGGLVIALNQAGLIGTASPASRPSAAPAAASTPEASARADAAAPGAAPAADAVAIITRADGSRLEVRAGSVQHLQTGDMLNLRSGQSVAFADIARLEVTDRAERADHVRVRLMLRNGTSLEGLLDSGLYPFSITAANSTGPVNVRIEELREIEFPGP